MLVILSPTERSVLQLDEMSFCYKLETCHF